MPSIVNIVKVVQEIDLRYTAALTAHPALVGHLRHQKLGNMLNVFCQVKLGQPIANGAILGQIPAQCVPALGTLYRYTSDNDTAPDVRQCRINASGSITNTSGLNFSAGHTILLSLTTPLV